MTGYRRLFVWVEGDDDVRFFESVVKPHLCNRYDLVEVRAYSCMRADKLDAFLKSIVAMGAEFIIACDMDGAPCYTEAKARLRRRVNRCDGGSILVIREEIEGWYLAGVSPRKLAELRVRGDLSADTVSKEQFNAALPPRFSRRDIMIEMLTAYDIRLAAEQSTSFDYMAQKYL